MFINKKSELTKLESFALGIAQWCILNPSFGKKNSREVFFTQINIATVSIGKLQHIPHLSASAKDFAELNLTIKENVPVIKGREYKAIKLKAFFTTFKEGDDRIPYVEANILFQKEVTGWSVFACYVNAIDYNTDCLFYTHFLARRHAEKEQKHIVQIAIREANFMTFCMDISARLRKVNFA